MKEPKTNPRTPSAQHHLGLAVCPRCDGSRRDETGGTCSFCEGAGRVTLERHHEHVGLRPGLGAASRAYLARLEILLEARRAAGGTLSDAEESAHAGDLDPLWRAVPTAEIGLLEEAIERLKHVT